MEENHAQSTEQTTPTWAQQPTVTPPEPTAKIPQLPKPKNLPIIVLCILLVLSLAATGLFVYQNFQLRQQLSLTQQIPQPTLSPTSTLEPTADWEIYSNVDYNFEFKYPPTYFITEEVKTDNNNYNVRVSFEEPYQVSDEFSTFTRKFSLSLLKPDKTLQDYIVEKHKLKEFKLGKQITSFDLDSPAEEIKEESLGSNKFIRVHTAGFGGGYDNYYIDGPRGVIVSTGNGFGSNVEYWIFSIILSTFKFLD